MVVKARIAVLAMLLCLPRGLYAQCPDGSAPPCRSSTRGAVAPPVRSVAVLYFENLSRDTTDVYLADGLTEDITVKLGQVGRLAVTSRAAVRRLRDAGARPIAELGRTLNVLYLVSGSIQRSGPRLRVSVELVRAAIGILERATPRGPWLWSYLIWPGFDSLRDDPRFIRIFEESKPPNAPDAPR